jgi:protein-S-isoprenylcysteine O-methyltransferase Ste14
MPLPTLVTFLFMIALFLGTGLIFFRKGRHTPAWFATLAPFPVGAFVLYLGYRGLLAPVVDYGVYTDALQAVATVLCCVAIALFGLTVGTHRIPIPMWHQPEDKPSQLVTWGAYRFVRHPFYTCYHLLFAGASLLSPTWPMLATAAYLHLVLQFTAIKEERELCATALGAEYRAFMARTGRFFPNPLKLLFGQHAAAGG